FGRSMRSPPAARWSAARDRRGFESSRLPSNPEEARSRMMNTTRREVWFFGALASSILVIGLLLTGPAWSRGGGDDGGGGEALKLRLNDAVGRPGGTGGPVLHPFDA